MGEGRRPKGARFLKVGLTGGIASGKSAVADLFAAQGVPVLDTDIIARDVVAPGSEGLARLAAAFGEEILDERGALDRRALRARVFADPAERKALEAIVHPLVLATLSERAAGAGGPYQIHVVPLLVENGLEDRFDRVLVVDCDPALQTERLLARDGGDREQARRMLAAQADRAARLAAADDVIANEGPLESLAAPVAQLDAFYRQLAASGEYDAPGVHRR
jgi:dephospho-CoA kinase